MPKAHSARFRLRECETLGHPHPPQAGTPSSRDSGPVEREVRSRGLNALTAVSSLLSMFAAFSALVFAWRTVHESRLARREDAHERRLAYLHRLVGLVAAVAEAARYKDRTPLGIALRLDAALTGAPYLKACHELVTVDRDEAFEAFLDAKDELGQEIARLATTTD
jgi:hypothetical protein